MTIKSKKVKLKGEKFVIMAILLLLFVATPLIHVYTQAKLSESNIEVQKLRQEIENQNTINESLNMQINELASLDNIREVASEQGLSYNNDNIKVMK